MDDGSASIFCFPPLRVPVSELDRLRAVPPSPESSLGHAGSAPALPQVPGPVGPSDSSTALMTLVEDLGRQVSQLHLVFCKVRLTPAGPQHDQRAARIG